MVEVKVSLPDGTPLAAWRTDADGTHTPIPAPGNWWEIAWAIHEHVTAERSIPRYYLPYFGGLELCGEAGELANLLKKDWRGDAGDRADAIAMELADVAIVTSFLARDLGVDLEAAIYAKLAILLNRWPAVKARLDADHAD